MFMSGVQSGVLPAEPVKPVYCTAMIRDDIGRYLMLKHAVTRTASPWRAPGGKPELGETIMACLARELKEEIGIEILHADYIATYEKDVAGKVWLGHFFTVQSFIGNIQIMEPNKHTEIRWMHAHELLREESYPEFTAANFLNMGGKGQRNVQPEWLTQGWNK